MSRPRTVPVPDRPRVGLVLGGGGIVGLAYHAAALAAIENDLGWDPRDAQVIVGTSAGSLVGALLRRDVPAGDLAALAVGAPAPGAPAAVAEALARRAALPSPDLRSLLRLRPPGVEVVTSWMRRPWRIDPVTTLTAFLADGQIDLADHVGAHARALGDAWPERPLWVCTVRKGDLRRVVFGRDRTPALPEAVMASCAIPGYFQPSRLGDEVFVDGGVRSPTNADVLRRLDLDLVVIVSPMSGREIPRLGLGAVVRRYAKAKVDNEVARLAEHGIPAVVIEPGAEVADVCGHDFMCDENLADIVAAGFLDTGDQLRRPEAGKLLADLRRRPLARVS